MPTKRPDRGLDVVQNALRIAMGAAIAFPLSILLAKPVKEWLPRVAETGLYGYQEVVSLEGVSSKDIYARAKLWAAKGFAKDAIQLDDPDGGRLVVKDGFEVLASVPMGALPGRGLSAGRVDYALTLETRDGRLRYTLDKLVFSGSLNAPPLPAETYKQPLEDDLKLFMALASWASVPHATLSPDMMKALETVYGRVDQQCRERISAMKNVMTRPAVEEW